MNGAMHSAAESHGSRTLASCGPEGHKELGTMKATAHMLVTGTTGNWRHAVSESATRDVV